MQYTSRISYRFCLVDSVIYKRLELITFLLISVCETVIRFSDYKLQ